VAQLSAMAWDRDTIGRYATAADRTFVVFDGRVYADPPVWLTVPHSLWARLKRELGFQAEATPLLTIIASANCDAERLPWGELG